MILVSIEIGEQATAVNAPRLLPIIDEFFDLLHVELIYRFGTSSRPPLEAKQEHFVFGGQSSDSARQHSS